MISYFPRCENLRVGTIDDVIFLCGLCNRLTDNTLKCNSLRPHHFLYSAAIKRKKIKFGWRKKLILKCSVTTNFEVNVVLLLHYMQIVSYRLVLISIM
jgi:hypothetical protein